LQPAVLRDEGAHFVRCLQLVELCLQR
jgi:hypothetical protein